MKRERPCTAVLIAMLAVAVLAGCDNESPAPGADAGEMVSLTVNVGETHWQATTYVVTRSGETLESLKAVADPSSPADGEGFSLHGTDLLGPTGRRQVTWNSSAGQWNAGDRIYWPRTTSGGTFAVYAYAPYKTDSYAVNGTTGKLNFTSADYNLGQTNPDLLYASATVKRSDGVATFTFRHALAKMLMGTVTNKSGSTMHLREVAVSGNLYRSGTLNLSTGEWTDLQPYDPALKTLTITVDTDPDADGNQPLEIPDGAFVQMNVGDLLLIPGPTVTPSLTFTEGVYSFSTTLEQGIEKVFSVSVGKNFEVIIE